MYQAAKESQLVAGTIAFAGVTSPLEIRLVLTRAIPEPRNLLERYVLEGLIALALQECHRRTSQASASNTDTLASRAASLLRDRFAEPWTIGRLAHELGTNRFRLTSEFKATMGVGIHRYLVRCRVPAAEDCIRAGDKIETAARAVGFRSKKTLYGAYRRVRGISLRSRTILADV
jgi:AraC-like DNA-binding protein